ncbi:MAG: rod shape-determining protein MreD [Gemmobacter sp.]|nr:rod shape-determining protein MreD [Gemmobacter sp.]
MSDQFEGGVWAWRGAYLLVVVTLVFLRLLPLPAEAGQWPAPDFVLCLTCAWVLRRPDYVPALMIGLVVFAEDLVLMRPPGLWAAMTLLGTEFLRSRASFSRELTFLTEWVMVATVMTVMTLGYRLILAVVMLPQAGLSLTLVQTVGSILTYPLVVGASRLIAGLRKPATGEVDARGRRL